MQPQEDRGIYIVCKSLETTFSEILIPFIQWFMPVPIISEVFIFLISFRFGIQNLKKKGGGGQTRQHLEWDM